MDCAEKTEEAEKGDLSVLLHDFKRNMEFLAPMSSDVSPSAKIELIQIEYVEKKENQANFEVWSKISYKAIGALVQDSQGEIDLYYWIQRDEAEFDEHSLFSKLDGYWQKSDSECQISDYEMQTLDTILVVYQKET